ncbi:hypothetical protein EDC04DRAFT_655849 [Pisolithus marmoratus]|nr:hypothetical protein EDC04DRAFT_655849 [Pisolithus marmoratus]
MDPTLLCWVRGDDVDDVFELEIPGEADVGELKQALKDRRSATFSDVDACNLHLYPLLVPSNADLAVQLGRWRLHDKKPLYVTQKLSDIFPKFRDGKWVVVVIHPTAGMEFSVYFRNQILPVSAVGDDTIKHFLSGLLRDQQYEHVFRNVSTQMLRVYRLNPPVLETKEGKYLDNLEPMKGTDTVEVSFGESTVTRRHVCLAFMRVEDESNKVIETLERVHTRIFSSLKITVRTALKWTMDDVQDNLAGGKYTEDGRANVAEIEKIQDLLSSVRIYDQTMQKHHDFKIAQEYGEDGGLFDKTFKALSEDQTDGTTVGNAREFFTFYRILHCWHEDASKIRDQRLSAVKAGSFAAYFIQPPFFSDFSPDIEYKTEIPWGFPIFVRTNDVLDIWRKYKPKSDLMASSANHLIPFFVSNAISMTNEGDRFRMLLQAIAAARAGNILLKKTSKRNFFVVAVYLDKNMVASRYIIIQTGEGSDEPAEEFRQGNAVSIHCNDFDLTDKIKAIEFLREMYNLAGELNSLVKDLDLDMTRTLKQVADAARSVLSLHSRNHPTVRMDFIPGQDEFDEGCGSEDEDEDGTNLMKDMGMRTTTTSLVFLVRMMFKSTC